MTTPSPGTYCYFEMNKEIGFVEKLKVTSTDSIQFLLSSHYLGHTSMRSWLVEGIINLVSGVRNSFLELVINSLFKFKIMKLRLLFNLPSLSYSIKTMINSIIS